MSLIVEKYDELLAQISRVAQRWQVDAQNIEDIQQEVIARLLEEDSREAFKGARALWGRATNLTRETVASMFAASLPLSGVSHQVHNAARLHLAANGGDPATAYTNQIASTVKVSRGVLELVAGGSKSFNPNEHNALPEATEPRLTEQEESTIMAAINGLPEVERNVVRTYVWGDGERLTLREVADRLGYSVAKTRAAWNRAKRRLSTELESLM